MSNFEKIRQQVREKRFEQEVARVDDEYLRSFSNSANHYLESAQKQYEGLGYGNVYQSYLNRRDSYNDLDYRRRVIQEWSKRNPGKLDQQATSFLDSFGKDSKGILDAFSGVRDYFSQFATEEDYKKSLYRPMTKEEAAQGEAEMRQRLEDYRRSDRRNADAEAAAENALGSLRFDPANLDLQLAQLPGMGLNQEELGYERAIDYYIQQGKAAQDRELMEADVAEVQAMGKEWEDLFDTYMVGMYDLENPNAVTNAVAVRNQLYAKFGQKRAEELAESWMRYRNQEGSEEMRQYAQQHADSGLLGKVAASGATVFANAMGTLSAPVGYLIEAGSRTGRYQTLDPNNPGAIPGQYASTVRGEIAKDIEGEEPGFGRKMASYAYQGGLSAADNLVRIAMGGGTKIGSLGLAAVGSFGSTLSEASSKGATPGEAVLLGVANAGLELLTEKYSIDNLFAAAEGGAESVKDILREVFKQAGVEASEEELSFLGGLAAEAVILREKSGYRQQIGELVAKGYSYEEAREMADMAIWNEAVDTAITSALSGGMMTGTTGSVQYAGRNAQVKKQYGEFQSELVAEGLESDPDSDSYILAEKYQGKLDKGKNLSGAQLNRLIQANERQFQVEQAQQTEASGEQTDDLPWVEEDDTEMQTYLDAVQRVTDGRETTEIQSEAEGIEVQAEAQAQTEAVQEPEAATVSKTEAVGEESATTDEEMNTQQEQTVTLEEAAKKYGAQAQAMIHTYTQGQDVAKFDAAYQAAYDMGRSGVNIDYALKSPSTAYLTEAQRGLAYEAGEAAANTAAHGRAAEIEAAANDKTGHRKGGLVRGEGVTIADLKKAVGDTRGTAYKTLSTIAKVTGVDIVLYKSTPDSTGKFHEAQGKYRRSEPGTIYIDVNAGLSGVKDADDLAKYTILRTFSHEFTHFIENWNPVQYNEFRKTVFDTLTQQGEDVEFLIEEKRKGGLDFEAASREVVAEAMTDILPDATFVQTLAESHKTIFQKLLDKLKEFTEKIRDYFASLGSNRSREANALKEQVGDTVKYLESIVKLFDSVAVEAVRNYQLTVAAEEVAVSEMESTTAEAQAEDAVGDNDATTADATISETETVEANNAEESSDNTQEDSDNETVAAETEAVAENATTEEIEAPTEAAIPPKAETEEAKQELRKAVRMPIQGTNMEALLEGIKNRELSLESVTLSGSVDGFNAEQRHHLVEKLLEGVYTDSEVIKIEVPYDGKFEIVNTPGNVAKVLENLKVKARQEAIFDKKTVSLLTSNGHVRIVDVGGQKYLSNSYVMLPATEAAVEYARTQLDGKENQLHPEVAKAFEQANKPLPDAPTEAKLDKTTVLIFSVDGKKLFFDKRLFSPLDGGQLYYAEIRGAGILKSVDSSGNVIGYLMGIRPSGKSPITGEKPSNLKSYQKKKLQEKPAEKAAPKQEAKTEPKKKPAPRKTESKASKPATVETSVKLEDFGEKIGGARKDQWSKRGLLAEDLDAMNDREREKNVKKDNVWKRPDYRKLIEGGADRNILFVRNEIRKALNQNIAYPYRVSDARKQQLQEEFVATVRTIQAMAEKVTTKEELAAMGRPWLMEQGYRTDTSFTEKWRRNAALHGTNYVQTIEHLVRNWDQLGKLADKANFAVDAEKKIPKGFSIHEDDENHTWFIARGNWVVRHSIPSYDEALNYLRNAASNTRKKTRFVPEQLLEVHRKGPDYRGSKDVKGQDYLDTFGFKGGEFGNWMTEKDRRVSMNYGFDALKDLADALGIADQDISLAGNLSIAFGARGQGLSGAAAHYEQERHVINLTKMNGAGSLAHEWFHALDDFLGGYGSKFATEYGSQLPETTKAAVRHLLTTMQYRDATQEETDMAATKAYEQARRSVTYQVANQFGWVRRIEEGKFLESDARYYSRKPTEADVAKYHELLDKLLETGDMAVLEELSALRKAVAGHVIPKEDRESIGFRLLSLRPDATKNVQKMRLRSDFYNNSRRFGELHHKDGDYWDSTIEMAARAFACYVTDKTGKHNDYLSAHSDTAVTLDVDKDGNVNVVRAFPVGEERVQINAAFDQLIAALKADGFLHEQGETVKPEMIQYQSRSYLSEDAETFRNEINSWERHGRPDGETFILGSTGAVLQGLGAIESDVYMQGDKINKIFSDHPEMTIKEIKEIPEILENPVMVLSSRNLGRGSRTNTRLTIFGMVKAQNGLPVMVAFDLHPVEGKLYLSDMQKVVSAYTKDSSPTAAMKLMQNSDVLYADKEKTASLLHTVGFQNAHRIEQSGYIGNITYQDDGVKIAGVKFSDVFTDAEQHQERTTALTDRDVLAMAADEVAVVDMTDGEKDALRIFKSRLNTLQSLQEERAEQGRIYREQQFGTKVNRDAAKETLNRMHVLDDQIQRASNAVVLVEQKEAVRQLIKKARRVVEQQEREHGQQVLKRWRDRRNDAEAIRKYRERLKADVDELTGWIVRPDNKSVVKHIPDAVKTSVIPFLQSIDFTSKRQLRGGEATEADKTFMEKLRKLESFMDGALDLDDMYEAYTDLPPDFLNRLHRFATNTQALIDSSGGGEFVVNRMTSQELKELSGIVRELKKYIMDMNRFHVNAVFKHVYEAGDSSIDYLSQMKAAKNTGAVSEFLLWQQMRPAYAFERFGKGGMAIYDGLRRGQATLAFNTEKIKAFSDKAYTVKEVQDWENQVKTIRLSDGETVKMKVSQIMSLYELSKRQQAVGHILGEGIRVATFQDKKGKISDAGRRITVEDLNTIIDTLNKRQKEVADSLQKFMQEQGGAWGNHVTLARFGEKQFGEPNYFPINSDGRHLSVDADERPGGAALYALLNMGFTKQTQEKAKNRIVVYSIFDVFANHMASMAQYNAFALPVVDALKWFNYKQTELDEDGNRTFLASVREEMDRVYGVPVENKTNSGKRGYAQNFVINIIKAFNGTEAQGTPYDGLGMQTLHRYNRAQVAYNFRVVVQQPLAVTRAALLLDYGSILKGMKLAPAVVEKNVREMRKYSGIAAWKGLGFYDVNISRGLSAIIKHDETWVDKVTETGMWAAEKADTWTWAAIWAACKEEVIAKQKLTPKSAGFYEAVTKLFEDVIYKTQVVDSVLTKNEFMRDKGFFARAVGSFMSEPTATASMLVDAFDKFQMDMQKGMTRQQAWKKNQRMIVRTAYVYGIGALALAAVQAVADAFRDDDDYQDFFEKWLEAFGGNLVDELMPLNKLPIVSDFYELVKELLSVMGVDTYGNPPQSVFMQWYDSLVKGVEILYDKISGQDTNYTWYGGVYKMLQALSGMTGLPMGAATREIVTAWNNTVGAMAPSLKVKTYDSGEKNEIKYAYQDGYLDDAEAAKLLLDKNLVDSENEAYWTIQGWEAGNGYSRYDAVYEAVRNGGDFDGAMKELTDHGYTEKDVRSQIKEKIGQWYMDGEITKQQATDMLGKYSGMNSEAITEAVNKWSCKVVTGIAFGDIQEEYLKGTITANRAMEMLSRFGGITREDARADVQYWKFKQEYPNVYVKSEWFDAYYNKIADSGIAIDTYMEYRNAVSDITGDDKKARRMEVIDSLNISDEQKDALYYAEGWAESRIHEAPWH